MKLYSLILDDFFAEPMKVREALLGLEYKDTVSPFDQVKYPDIAADIPSWISDELQAKITLLLGHIVPMATFARLSTLGNTAPHQAHTDTVMGQFTALVYMNHPDHCYGGTSVLEHVSGMNVQPTTQEGIDLLARDTNNLSKWITVGGAHMKFNRLFLVASELFHRAEPVGGFGKDLNDGRLVLTMFFNAGEHS